jgi:hypothetical protein
MKTFAIIENNKVSNVVVAETLEDAQFVFGDKCVEYTAENPAGIGWDYNGATFEQPVEEATE